MRVSRLSDCVIGLGERFALEDRDKRRLTFPTGCILSQAKRSVQKLRSHLGTGLWVGVSAPESDVTFDHIKEQLSNSCTLTCTKEEHCQVIDFVRLFQREHEMGFVAELMSGSILLRPISQAEGNPDQTFTGTTEMYAHLLKIGLAGGMNSQVSSIFGAFGAMVQDIHKPTGDDGSEHDA